MQTKPRRIAAAFLFVSAKTNHLRCIVRMFAEKTVDEAKAFA